MRLHAPANWEHESNNRLLLSAFQPWCPFWRPEFLATLEHHIFVLVLFSFLACIPAAVVHRPTRRPDQLATTVSVVSLDQPAPLLYCALPVALLACNELACSLLPPRELSKLRGTVFRLVQVARCCTRLTDPTVGTLSASAFLAVHCCIHRRINRFFLMVSVLEFISLLQMALFGVPS